MKTSKSLNQIAKVTFASVTILFASLMPMQAATGKITSSDMNEVQAASNRLAMYNMEIEKSVEFTAPVLIENFEVVAAESRLEDLFGYLAQAAVYSSPADVENLEAAEAIEDLDALNAQIEQSVRFTASIAE